MAGWLYCNFFSHDQGIYDQRTWEKKLLKFWEWESREKEGLCSNVSANGTFPSGLFFTRPLVPNHGLVTEAFSKWAWGTFQIWATAISIPSRLSVTSSVSYNDICLSFLFSEFVDHVNCFSHLWITFPSIKYKNYVCVACTHGCKQVCALQMLSMCSRSS